MPIPLADPSRASALRAHRGSAEELREELQQLATRLGRTPNPGEVRALLSSKHLSRNQLTLLAEAIDDLQQGAAPTATQTANSPTESLTSGAPTSRAEPILHNGARPEPAEPALPLSAHVPRSTQTDSPPPIDRGATGPVLLPVTAIGSRPTTTVVDKLVRRTIEDLVDDWHRAGGLLRFEDFSRLVSKRELDGLQAATVRAALSDNGIEIADSIHRGEPGASVHDDGETTIDLDVDTYAVDIVKQYLREIARNKLLFAEDEVRLANEIRAGVEADCVLAEAEAAAVNPLDRQERRNLRRTSSAGRRAHHVLVTANLRLVVSIARHSRYATSGLDLMDRVQDGSVGLMRAADKFDPNFGTKFSTYATWWIRQTIERAIADTGRLIRIPVHAHEKMRVMMGVRAELTRRLGRVPALHELADEIGQDPATVQAMLDWSQPVRSLDALVRLDGDTTVGDLLAAKPDIDGHHDPVDVILIADRNNEIQSLLDVLSERERFVITRRFGFDDDVEHTLEEVGALLGVTRERVRQNQKKALTKLRCSPRLPGLDPEGRTWIDAEGNGALRADRETLSAPPDGSVSSSEPATTGSSPPQSGARAL